MRIFSSILRSLAVAWFVTGLSGVAGASATGASAQSPANVLVVLNESSPDSVRVGEHYARARGVSATDVLRVAVEPADEISRDDFARRIQAPIAEWFGRHRAHDRILYIVVAKGIPLRIKGTPGRNGAAASVDSELALLYRRMAGFEVPVLGSVRNPFFLGEQPIGEAKRFTREEHDVFLVTRLDGFTADEAVGLVDRAQVPASSGRVLLDQRAAWSDQGNEWLKQAARRLSEAGHAGAVVLEPSSLVLSQEDGVIGYFSWGSNDPAITERNLGLSFVPGALAAIFVSTDARTFREPPAGWRTGQWSDPSTFFAGSPQSLTGDLVRAGVTGAAGYVAEPYLDASVRPDILFPAYFAGFNLAESFYLAVPYLSWQTVVVGDPLCSPFGAGDRPSPAAGGAGPGLDEATELPRFFAERRLRVLSQSIPNPEAAALMARAESRVARGDRAGAREALEKAAKLAPPVVALHLALAALDEEAGDWARAEEGYRRILEIDPSHAVALNNLAYSLAAREGKPGDALPLAERAYALSGGNASIADTLGWIHHLLGNDARAAPFLAEAVRLAPGNAEIRLHMAVVLAARGMVEAAATELAKAVELDAALEERDEVRQLRGRLKVEKRR